MKRAHFLSFLAVACGPGPAPSAPTAVVARTPDAPPSESPQAPASPKAPLPRARIQLAFGRTFGCVRLDGGVHCWKGENARTPLASLSRVSGVTDAVDLALGWGHACVATKSGGVLCWGENGQGQLGAGLADEERDTPVDVPGLTKVSDVSAGSWHTCALQAAGAVTCWGRNREGQTGSDVAHTPAARELVLPTPVDGVANASALATGRDVSCALGRQGALCWGRFVLADQKSGGGYQSSRAAAVSSLDDALSIDARDETLCGVFEGGHVACWGSGAFSLLPSRPLHTQAPAPVPLERAESVAVGSYHACAIVGRERSVSCWGIDAHGQLGHGKTDGQYDPRAPARVAGLEGVRSLALGSLTSCALTDADELWCWGRLPFTPDGKARDTGTPERIAIR